MRNTVGFIFTIRIYLVANSLVVPRLVSILFYYLAKFVRIIQKHCKKGVMVLKYKYKTIFYTTKTVSEYKND